MIFRNGVRKHKNLIFFYGNEELEMTDSLTYLVITFSSSGSFNKFFDACGALNAVFKLKKILVKVNVYLYKTKSYIFNI